MRTNPFVRPTVRPVTRTVALVGVAMLALTACGDDPAATAPASSEPSVEAVTPLPQDSTVTPTPAVSTPATAADVTSLLAAGATAQRELGGTVTTIDSEPTGWEVHVVLSDGTEREVGLSPDGKSIVNGPFDDRDDADDQRENQAMVEAAELGYRAAVDAVQEAVAGGEIVDLDLDSDDGRVTWDASVYDGSGVEQNVVLDAVTGEVIFTGADD